jgi:molecular chaperone HtpG
LKQLFSIEIPQLHIQVELKGLSPDDLPVIATRPEFSRRMKEMSAMNGASSFYMQMPDEVQLTVNTNHPIYSKILSETNKSLKEKKIKTLADLAILSQGLLKGNELTEFIQRNIELMEGDYRSSLITEI